MNDAVLEAALYASRRSKRGHRRIEEPDWAGVHRELKRKHVILLILWDEYIAANPGGYSYSRFCELYRVFEKTLSVTMRQTHAAGERLFVDYAGVRGHILERAAPPRRQFRASIERALRRSDKGEGG
jgi:transposase